MNFFSKDALWEAILDTARAIITGQILSLIDLWIKLSGSSFQTEDPTYPIDNHIYHFFNVKCKLSLFILIICLHTICK